VILQAMLEQDSRILKAPAPAVFVEGYSAGTGATINCTFRVSHEHAAQLQRDFIEEARRRLEQCNVGTPQQINPQSTGRAGHVEPGFELNIQMIFRHTAHPMSVGNFYTFRDNYKSTRA
jgi:hypothetical protein